MRNTLLARVGAIICLVGIMIAGCSSSKDDEKTPGKSPTGLSSDPAADPAGANPEQSANPNPSAPPAVDMPEPPAMPATGPFGSPSADPGAASGGMAPGQRPNPLRRDEGPGGSGNPMRDLGPAAPGAALAPPSGSDPFRGGGASGVAPADATDVPAPAPPVVAPLETTPPSEPTSPPMGPAPPTIAPPSDRPGEGTMVPSDTPGTGPQETVFDPIKENGPIFVDWPKPILAIIATGREDGYMEPCGCAGLDRMKGGLQRRHTMIEWLRQMGWPTVCVDVGGLSKGYGRQTEIKFYFTVEAMRKIGYDAMGFGKNDLRLPAGELVAAATDPSPFLSANVGLLGFDAQATVRSRIVERNGIKVGITSVLGKSFHDQINNQEIELADPATAIGQVLPELRQKCNLLILLAYATKEESIALAKQFPDFGLVVTSGGPSEPPPTAERIEGAQSLLIEVGEKGANAVVLGLYDDPKLPLRYQRVPLDSRFAGSPAMKRFMVLYQDQLRSEGLDGLAVKPVSHPQFDPNGGFVGSAKCKDCHEESYAVWKKSGHAKAWETLKKADPPRDADPECVSCHVVGWHPTQYFPYKTGFLDEAKTPHLVDVGCESCHGPGEAHCKAEEGGDMALQEKLQKTLVVTKAESQTSHVKWCQNCHDLDNSPEFNFETYWPKVEHYETK